VKATLLATACFLGLAGCGTSDDPSSSDPPSPVVEVPAEIAALLSDPDSVESIECAKRGEFLRFISKSYPDAPPSRVKRGCLVALDDGVLVRVVKTEKGWRRLPGLLIE
jgi:hypothetical protein